MGNGGADNIIGGADNDTCHGNAGDDAVDCEIISKKK
ncbi:MAG: hypothetical protein J4F36_13550 [Nitrosopumilaceae archaeon]|nr:hypothetical protein [Nitrosopumilaceae archaeon]